MAAGAELLGEHAEQGLHLAVDDDGVDALLPPEVFVDHRFGHLGPRGDLFHGRPLETLGREEFARDAHELLAALASGHPHAGRGLLPGGHPVHHALSLPATVRPGPGQTALRGPDPTLGGGEAEPFGGARRRARSVAWGSVGASVTSARLAASRRRRELPVEVATGARLRLWSRVWRYLLVLVIAIGGFSATLVAAFEAGDAVVRGSLAARLGGPEPLVVLDAAVGLAVMALLPWRRRAPVLVGVVTGLATGVAVTAAGPATLAAVSMATARDPVRLAVVGASWLTGGLLYEYLVVPSGMPLWTTVLAVVAGYAICAAIG